MRLGRERLLGALVTVVGVAVAAVVGYALLHPHSAPVAASTAAAAEHATSLPSPVRSPADPSPATSAAASSTPSAPATTAGNPDARAPLVVLNNTTIAGLAGQAASRFRDAGWTVTDLGNLRDDILSSCAYYDPATTGARDAAAALKAQFPGLRRVQPKFDGLPAGAVVVVLTSDWS